MRDSLAELAWRGLVHQATGEQNLAAWLTEKPRTVYAGFDPTADSLHVGHAVSATNGKSNMQKCAVFSSGTDDEVSGRPSPHCALACSRLREKSGGASELRPEFSRTLLHTLSRLSRGPVRNPG